MFTHTRAHTYIHTHTQTHIHTHTHTDTHTHTHKNTLIWVIWPIYYIWVMIIENRLYLNITIRIICLNLYLGFVLSHLKYCVILSNLVSKCAECCVSHRHAAWTSFPKPFPSSSVAHSCNRVSGLITVAVCPKGPKSHEKNAGGFGLLVSTPRCA